MGTKSAVNLHLRGEYRFCIKKYTLKRDITGDQFLWSPYGT